MEDIHWYQVNGKSPKGIKKDVRSRRIPQKQGASSFGQRAKGPFPAAKLLSPLYFYQQSQQRDEQHMSVRRKVSIVFLVLTLLFSGGMVLFSLGKQSYTLVYANAETGKSYLEKAKTFLMEQNFPAAVSSFAAAREAFSNAKQTVEPLSYLPIDKRINAAYRLLSAAEQLSYAGQQASQGAAPLYELITATDGEHGLNLTAGNFLQEIMIGMASAQSEFREAYNAVQSAERSLEDVDEALLSADLRERVTEIKTLIPELRDLLDLAYNASQFLPQLLGNTAEQKYMVIFQNYHELRPTGGFPGTFSIVAVEKAAVKEMYTKNVYDTDGQFKDYVEPPEPLKPLLLGGYSWNMRDSLWDPDFPTSVSLATWFYRRAMNEVIDGVIAIDPEVVQRLLQLLGPTSIWYNGQSITITPDNFIDIIEGEERKVPEGADPRRFLIDLTDVIVKQLLSLRKDQWPMLVSLLRGTLEERHLQINFDNPLAQAFIQKQHWAGAIEDVPLDYVMVNVANVGGTKASQFIHLEQNLSVELKEDGTLYHRLTLVFQHTGTNVLPSAPTRNYIRVYVPEGSKLIGATGTKEGITGINVAHHKTIFDDYLFINPGEIINLQYEYTTPFQLLDQELSRYAFYAQKQAGTVHDKLKFSLKLPPSVKAVSAQKSFETTSDNTVWILEDLKKDVSVDLLLKKY